MNEIEKKAIEHLRVVSVEAIQSANSGHPGIALGAAPIIHTLYGRIMHLYPKEDQWINRDRFVMAAGHGSALLYTMLHLTHHKLSLDDLKSFRAVGSITPGHPETHLTPGVDVSSGPLGQGFASSVGMAIAEAHLHAKFPDLIDHYTYVLCGDGDLQEGITQEAASLAGMLELHKLIVLYDSNDIQLDGPVIQTNLENTQMKFEAMRWFYQKVDDGNDVNAIEQAIRNAQQSKKPSIIEVKTTIGYGASNQGSSSVHGSPLKKEEVIQMRHQLGGAMFDVEQSVYDYYEQVLVTPGEKRFTAWQEKALENDVFQKMLHDDFNIDFSTDVPSFGLDYIGATRVSSGAILKKLNSLHPGLIGGSADLSSSTQVFGADGEFCSNNRLGRNIKFGVREHAMAAISNGIGLHGGLRPFCSGFFVFSDYMKPAMRLSAIMHLPIIYIFTHDSVAVGEDGPTHQPIEQLTMLRSIPNMMLIRPADANETKEAYRIALQTKDRPIVIVLTRQNLSTLVLENETHVSQGAYIIKDNLHAQGVLIASGSEVELAMKAQAKLESLGHPVRVVSMPSIDLFEAQSIEYKQHILPPTLTKRLAIEASDGAHLYRYVGSHGAVKGLTSFGESGKGPLVMEKFGFSVDQVVEAYLNL